MPPNSPMRDRDMTPPRDTASEPAVTSRGRRFMQVGFLVMGLASLAGLIGLVLTGLEKVHTGHGLDTYRTTWLVEFNWVGFLVLVAAIVVALIGGAFLRYLEWREVKDLKARYGADDA